MKLMLSCQTRQQPSEHISVLEGGRGGGMEEGRDRGREGRRDGGKREGQLSSRLYRARAHT